MVWFGCIGGTPTRITYQEERCMHAPPTWIGEQGSGWMVHVGGIGGMQGWVYLSCRAGVSCRMLFQIVVIDIFPGFCLMKGHLLE